MRLLLFLLFLIPLVHSFDVYTTSSNVSAEVQYDQGAATILNGSTSLIGGEVIETIDANVSGSFTQYLYNAGAWIENEFLKTVAVTNNTDLVVQINEETLDDEDHRHRLPPDSSWLVRLITMGGIFGTILILKNPLSKVKVT